MTHHLFVKEGSTTAVDDGDLLILQHFIIQALNTAKRLEDARLISLWRYGGPGVWNIDSSVIEKDPGVLLLARSELEQFGGFISGEYLHKNIGSDIVKWNNKNSTVRIESAIDNLY